MDKAIQKFSFVRLVSLLVCALGIGSAMAAWDGTSTQKVEKDTVIKGKHYFVIENEKNLAWFSDTVNTYAAMQQAETFLMKDLRTWLNTYKDTVSVEMSKTIANLYIDGMEEISAIEDSVAKITRAQAIAKNIFSVSKEDAIRVTLAILKSNSGKEVGVAFNAFVSAPYLDMGGKPFIPIAAGTGAIRYAGIFDGNGVTISNLSVHSEYLESKAYIYGQNVGMFGTISGTVKNVVLDNVDIQAHGQVQDYLISDNSFVSTGAIVGWMPSGTIEGCYVSGSVDTYKKGQAVGGIVGTAFGGTIKNTLSVATIKVAGDRAFVGGLVGRVKSGTVKFESSVYDGSLLQNTGTSGATGGLIGLVSSKANITEGYYDSDAAASGVGSVEKGGAVEGDNTGVGNSVVNQEEYVCLLNKGTWNNGSCTGAKTNIWSKHTNITNQGVTKDSKGRTLYVITFDANEGSFSGGATTRSKELYLEDPITSQGIDDPIPASDSNVFGKNWSLSKNGEPGNLGKVYKPTTVYAYWKDAYKITFSSKPGFFPGEPATQQKEIWIEEGEPITIDFDLPTEYMENGIKYYFAGWKDSQGNPVQTIGNATKESSFSASWTIAPTFTVSFDVQGHGVAPEAQHILDNELATDPGELVEKGYTFGGWYEDLACTKKFEFDKVQITKNSKVYAKWTRNIYAILYENLKDATYNPADYPKTYNVDTTIDLSLLRPSREGYDFEGWFLDETFDTPISHINDMAEKLTLYANWARTTYIITYTPDEFAKEAIVKDAKDYDTPINLRNETFTAIGRVQDGWSKTLNGDIDYDFDAVYSDKANLDLYPHWKLQDYTIDYVLNGGKFSETPVLSYNLDSAEIKFKTPTKDGYIFKGWCTTDVTENCPKTVTSFKPNAPYGDTAFYAMWEQITVTVTTKNKSKVFDGTPLVVDPSEITVTFPKGVDYTAEAASTVSVTHVAEGEVEATCDQLVIKNSDGVIVTDSFKIEPNYGIIKINPRPLSFTGKTQTLTYTGEEIALTDMTVSGKGLVAGHTHDDVVYSAAGTDVGEYDGVITPAESAVIKDAEENDVTMDYAITTTPGKLTITPAKSFTVTLKNETVEYDGESHANTHECETPEAKTGSTNCEYQFKDDVKDDEKNWTKNLGDLTRTDAGTYTINVRATNPNYTDTAKTTAKLIIEKRPVTVVVEGKKTSVKVEEGSHVYVSEGYTVVSASDPLYDVSNVKLKKGMSASVSLETVGKKFMNLASKLENVDGNFDVEFDVSDGYIEVADAKIVTVTIRGHQQTVDYDGVKHSVSGYDVSIDHEGYSLTDFVFNGNSVVEATSAGTYPMGLDVTQFEDKGLTDFEQVKFNVIDGGLVVNPIKKTLTITANSVAQGNGKDAVLTDPGFTFTPDVLAEGDYIQVVIEGSVTGRGSSENEILSYVIKNSNDEDVTASYENVKTVNGKLTGYPVVAAKYGDGETDTVQVVLVNCPETEDLEKSPLCLRKQVKNSLDSLSDELGEVLPRRGDSEDSTYAFNTYRNKWHYNEDKDWYEPEFESLVKQTEIVVRYGETPNDTIHLKVNVPVTRNDSLLNKAIVNGLNNHNPRIPLPTKTETWDSTYTFAQKWEKDTDGAYVPLFKSEVKEKELKVIYASKTKYFWVDVLVTDDENLVIEKIQAQAEVEGVTPEPYPRNANYDYEFRTWVMDPENDEVYRADFIMTVKKDTIVAVVGPEDSVKVIVDRTDDEDERTRKIDSTLASKEPKIVPVPTDPHQDSVYTFEEWEKDPACKTCYNPIFSSEVKDDTIVVAYAKGKSIDVVIKVTDSEEEIARKIDSTMASFDPPLQPEKTNPHKDSSYVFSNWKKDSDKHYVPEFTPVAKIKDIVVAYGDGPSDTLWVKVKTLDSEDDISKAISDTLAKHKPKIPLPPKVIEDDDSTYVLDGWKQSAEDSTRYEAVIVGIVKKDTIVVKYGKKATDTIHVEIHVTDNDAKVNQKINAAIKSHVPAIPTPTKKSTEEQTFTFNSTWHKNEKTSYYEPGFTAAERSREYVIKYGDGTADTISTMFFVVDVNTQEKLDQKIGEFLEQSGKVVPSKVETEDSTFVLHWKEKQPEGWHIPEFEGVAKSVKIIVKYGDKETDTVYVVIRITDTDSIIESKIEEALPKQGSDSIRVLPVKDADSTYTYEFEKFVRNDSTDVYEPTFARIARVFDVIFHLPAEGDLTAEFNGYTYGKVTMLPSGYIKGDSTWEFKGWYQKKNGLGERYKAMLATDYGDKDVYPLFQKTIRYDDARGETGEIVVIYSGSAEKTIDRALAGVIPENYKKGQVTYTFDKWQLKDGVYTATFVDAATGLPESRSVGFTVATSGRALEISGAKIGSKVMVYDVQGVLVAQDIVTNGTRRIELSRPGSYVVRVNRRTLRVNVE